MTRLALPLPWGPVMVTKVLGYSASHLDTCFSASLRSFHASFPRASSDSSGVGVLERPKEKDEGRTKWERMSGFSIDKIQTYT